MQASSHQKYWKTILSDVCTLLTGDKGQCAIKNNFQVGFAIDYLAKNDFPEKYWKARLKQLALCVSDAELVAFGPFQYYTSSAQENFRFNAYPICDKAMTKMTNSKTKEVAWCCHSRDQHSEKDYQPNITPLPSFRYNK